MKSYLKFLSRNKLYTAIEAVGLIVSLAFVILIGSYVRHQWQVAHGAPEWKHYYAIGTANYEFVQMAPTGLAWLIKENLPGVDRAAMYRHLGFEPEIEGETLQDKRVTVVEPDFFEMFRVEWVEGDAASLNSGSIAVSEQMANRLGLGREIIGRRLTYRQDTLVVSAVFRSLGGPIFEWSDFLEVREWQTLSNGMSGGTTCLIDSSLPEDELILSLDTMLDVHAQKRWGRDETRAFKNGCIERLDRLYFSDLNNEGLGFTKGNLSLLRMLLAVVLLLLLSAVFNYINLSTALAGRRTKETGMRAILGASRGEIVRRYLRESLLFTSVCAVLAVLLSQALTPLLSRFVDVRYRTHVVSVPFTWQWDAWSVGILVLLVLAVGLLAGWIPARLASRYNPAQVVKGDYRLRSKRVFSKLFIVFQTALAVLLISFGLVMERQYNHMIHRPVGADVDGLYVQRRVSDAQEDELGRLPFVSAIGHADGYPGERYMKVSAPGPDGERTLSFSVIQLDPEAFRMCEFEVMEDYHLPQGAGVWLSETAWHGLEMEPGQTSLPEGVNFFQGSQVAGVLRDFATTDAAHVEPDDWSAVVVREPLQGAYLLFRIEGDRKAAAKQLTDLYRLRSEERFGSERFAEANGFVEDKLRSGLADAERYMRLIELFMVLAVLVSLLGLLAMSALFAGERTHDVAVRKVFGSTVGSEVVRGVREYMLLVLIACILAVPVAVWLTGRYLEGFYYRISGYGWIFAVAVVIALLISFFAVLWQTLKAAKTNPAVELKKE